MTGTLIERGMDRRHDLRYSNLDHFAIGIIVNYAVERLLCSILINLLFRVVLPDHPDSYSDRAVINTREI